MNFTFDSLSTLKCDTTTKSSAHEHTLNARIDGGASVDALYNEQFSSLSKLIRITNDAVDCVERRKKWLPSNLFQIFSSFDQGRVIS